MARATRMPKQVYAAVSAGLEHGPVLVQTPRRGYAASLACERCRTPARCEVCTGPLGVAGPAVPPACRWCGTVVEAWACPVCGHRGLRAPVVGERRTAEELGRAFPSIPVVASGGDHVVGARSRRGRRSSSPRREPSRWPRAATPRSCSSTPGWPWPAPTCAPRRRRCAAGAARPGWSRPVAPSWSSATPRSPGRPGAGALGPCRVRPARGRGPRRGPPAAGQPARHDHRRARGRRRRPHPARPAAGRRGARPGGGRRRGVAGGRPGARAPTVAALSRALGEVQRVRSARKLDPVRIQVDPVTL